MQLYFLNEDNFYFLRFIYLKKEVTEKTIKKKRKLSQSRFDEISDFALTRRYVDYGVASKSEDNLYVIMKKGIDYLLAVKEVKEERRNANWIKWATIVLALSALINITDLLLYKPETRSFLIKQFFEATSVFLGIVKGGIVIFALFILTKLIFYLVRKFRKKNETKKRT